MVGEAGAWTRDSLSVPGSRRPRPPLRRRGRPARPRLAAPQGEGETNEVVMAAKRPDFVREWS